MFSKTIQYEDFNGVQTSKVFYFHMSKTELLALAADGVSMQERIKKMIAANDGQAIINELRELIKMAVGVRSGDGQRFLKDEQAQSQLFDSPAYDELLMELATDADKSAEFVRQLVPEKMQKEMLKSLRAQKDSSPSPFGEDPLKVDSDDDRPAWLREERNPTEAEIAGMTKAELAFAMQRRVSKRL